MRTLARFIANSTGWLSRRLGRGGGTTLPGVVLLRLRPNALAEFSEDLRYGTLLISATNGKTTTTRLVAAATPVAGYHVVTNTEGSNLERGIATALLQTDKTSDLGLFEVDEAALGAVAQATQPSVIVLMNLFRDQLDRYGELEVLVDKWANVLDDLQARHEPPTLVLNADDPNIAALGRGRANVVWFGIDDKKHGSAERDHAVDATTCRQCGSALDHALFFVGHLGHWNCPQCDATRPTPTVSASEIALRESGQSVTIRYPAGLGDASIDLTIDSTLPGLHNSYNVTAAFAATYALARRFQRPQEAHAVGRVIGETKPAFGRGETVDVDDKQIRLLLAKNPTGVNQNVRMLLTEPRDIHALVLLNDRTADGQDVSWIWDVDWERLEPHIASLTLGGDRAWDLALRFQYGGFNMDKIRVSPDIEKALDVALQSTPAGQTLHALPTYTAMLDLRWVLTQRGHTSAYWSDDQ